MKKRKNVKRFQDCNFIIKIFRYRWYFLIPFKDLIDFSNDFLNKKIKSVGFLKRLKLIHSLNLGEAQLKMNWFYTSDEVYRNFKNRKV